MTRVNLDPAVRLIGLAAMILCSGSAIAVGLGSIQVQSGLGQSLKLAIPLIGADSADLQISCIKFRIQSLDGAFIAAPMAAIIKSAQGQSSLLITTSQAVNEPAISVSVDLACESRVHRDFQILLDPVSNPRDPMATLSADSAALTPGSKALASPDNRSSGGNVDGVERTRTKAVAMANRDRQSSPDMVGVTRAPSSLAPRALATRNDTPRSILRLSSQGLTATELLSLGQLRLSRRLSEPTLSVNRLPLEELVAAQRRYARLLRGEDTGLQAEQASMTLQKQMATLKQQSEAARVQHAADQAAFYALQKNSLSFDWVAGLVILLFGSFGVVGWMGWKMRSLHAQPTAMAWDLGVFHTEPLITPDLAASNIASEPTTTSRPTVVDSKAVHEASDSDASSQEGRALPVSSQRSDLPFSDKEAMPQETTVHEALQFYPARVEHLKVEEISDVMQEAEFWLSLNDPARAIEILEPYGKFDVPESPMPWLFLLDLYRECDNQSGYEALREKAMRVFNTRIPLWNEVSDIAPSTSLEDYPRIVDRICELWGSDYVVEYLESLMMDNRDGVRRGFAIEVYQEVMLLMAMAKDLRVTQPPPVMKAKPGLIAS